MDLSGLTLLRLNEDTTIKPFDCDDVDLNEFIITKAKRYLNENLATTFIIEDEKSTIAYYSLLNDSLRIEGENFASKTAVNRFVKNLVGHGKRHLKYFPAVKIGRLAVSSHIQKSGLGRMIINNVISYSISVNNECACKLITVDAYSQSLKFYEKMGFEYLTDSDEGKSERQMFLDLTPMTLLASSK